jgi:hypothetical protein
VKPPQQFDPSSDERTCHVCWHRSPRGVCSKPVAAGLSRFSGAFIAPDGWAAACPAFITAGAAGSTAALPQSKEEPSL